MYDVPYLDSDWVAGIRNRTFNCACAGFKLEKNILRRRQMSEVFKRTFHFKTLCAHAVEVTLLQPSV